MCPQVTLIPTFDSLAMHEWYQETHDRQRDLSVTVLGSNSTVAMQEETFPACKVEFWGPAHLRPPHRWARRCRGACCHGCTQARWRGLQSPRPLQLSHISEHAQLVPTQRRQEVQMKCVPLDFLLLCDVTARLTLAIPVSLSLLDEELQLSDVSLLAAG